MVDKPEKIILTGDRPTGKLHVGHYAGSLQKRTLLQDEGTQFVMIADMQALTDHAHTPTLVRESVVEVARDNIAAGVDPEKTTLFIQSQVPQIAELTMYFLNLVTLARLKRNPTVKDEMRQKGYGDDVPAGFLMYPVSQAADMLFCRATVVPVGEDQKAMIEQANEIVRKFNSLYGETFSEVEAVISEHARLPGIDGKAKMSKSLGNAIYLSDSSEEVDQKVMQMYTDPGHVHKDDPGHVEGNVVFTYLDAFDPHKDELNALKAHYEKGGVGDVEIKKRLIVVLNSILEPIRERREAIKEEEIMEILREGSKKAYDTGERTLREVKEKMHITYFNNIA